jgi:hypothetical protein
MRYYLTDFENYIKNNVIQNLSEEIFCIIEKLANEVGSPEYSKAPQFNKNNRLNKLRKKKSSDLNDLDWNSYRQFQPTEFVKREGLDINIFNIRKCLNILTEKNYDTILNNISSEFDQVISTKTPNDILVLCNLFYEIVSTNILFSNLYAKLYKDLIDKSDNLSNIIDKNIKLSRDKIDEINYIDPDINYDKFCENNKINEKKRAEFTFLSNLMKYDILSYDKIYDIIEYLFLKLDDYIQEGNKKNELDEVSELIYVLVINSLNIVKQKDNNKYDIIVNNIKKIANMKVKTTPGITNKCIFKHMDLLDEL